MTMRLDRNLNVRVIANKPIAFESPDHLIPRGTANDNSVNQLFNVKLNALLKKKYALLDIGCAGGGFVKACLDEDNFATGLEGSDYSKKFRRAEWATIPEKLFTADVTDDVKIEFTENGTDFHSMLYDVVTSWEFMEHIHERDIPKIIENVDRHLAVNGLWVMSVASIDDIVNGVNYHQTVKPREWWVNFFENHGYLTREDLVRYFNNDWVRGPLQGADSFHLVLQRKSDTGLVAPSDFSFRNADLLNALNYFFDQAVRQTPTSNGNYHYVSLIARELEQSGFSGNTDILFTKAFSLASIGRFRESLLELQFILSNDPLNEKANNLRNQVYNIIKHTM